MDPRGDAGTRWDAREERTSRADDRAGGRETPTMTGEGGKGDDGRLARARARARTRVGMERSWVQRFLRDVGG